MNFNEKHGHFGKPVIHDKDSKLSKLHTKIVIKEMHKSMKDIVNVFASFGTQAATPPVTSIQIEERFRRYYDGDRKFFIWLENNEVAIYRRMKDNEYVLDRTTSDCVIIDHYTGHRFYLSSNGNLVITTSYIDNYRTKINLFVKRRGTSGRFEIPYSSVIYNSPINSNSTELYIKEHQEDYSRLLDTE